MISYPVWEIPCRLVTFGNGGLGLLLLLASGILDVNASRNGDSNPLEIICNATVRATLP